VNLPNLSGHIVAVHTVPQTLPYAALGVLFLALTVLVTPSFAQIQAVVAKALLGPTKAARLTVKADHLQASRARGVDAAEAERRRIERDLHDGAQQRLVAVAMTLGRARNKLADDPESARLLIDEAHADAKLAVAELRDLARGIYPAVLGDRGLDAALSALAARCPVPVDVEVDAVPRPPAAVESTAYFIVAETLTNVAKHSTATTVGVLVRRTGDAVTVRVTDDGAGGAELRTGGGLAGLADRAATIDGVMSVSSPPGGPTVITAELPCEW
jgi:signal transduction histidine kinase